MSSDPSVLGWSLEDTTNAFDAVDAPWYYLGVGQQGPLIAIRDRNEAVSWINPSALTTSRGYGRQRPMLVSTYFLMNGLPIYHAMGKKTDTGTGSHLFEFMAKADRLPKYQLRYQERAGIVDTIVQWYNVITHSLALAVDYRNPMMANEIMMGTDRWISDNSTWCNGATSATGYTSAMNNPVLYTGTDTKGFYLDPLSEVDVGVSGSEVDIGGDIQRFKVNLSVLPYFIYESADTFREEVFPADLYESMPMIPSSIDIDMNLGIENTLLKGSLEGDDIIITAKFYSDATNYIQIDCVSSQYSEAYISYTDPYTQITNRLQRFRFMCDYTTHIHITDGVDSIAAHQ